MQKMAKTKRAKTARAIAATVMAALCLSACAIAVVAAHEANDAPSLALVAHGEAPATEAPATGAIPATDAIPATGAIPAPATDAVAATEAIPATATEAIPASAAASATGAASGSDSAYEPSVVLASLAEGVDPEQALAALADAPALAGIALTGEPAGNVVKLSLPAGLAVDQALEAIDAIGPDVIAHAQPDYRYHLQETASASDRQANVQLARIAAASSTRLVAGTALGSALGVASGVTAQAQSITPSDALYDKQWYLASMNVQEAWSTVLAGASANAQLAATATTATPARSVAATPAAPPTTAVTTATTATPAATSATAATPAAPPTTPPTTTTETTPVASPTTTPAASSATTPAATTATTATTTATTATTTTPTTATAAPPTAATSGTVSPVAAITGADAAAAFANPVTIAVMDADFNYTHEDLGGNVIARYSCTSSHSRTSLHNLNNLDDMNHGTHTAGTIAAVADNGIGIAGVTFNMCKVYPMRVSDSKGGIATSDIVEAYNVLVKNASRYNVRVVSMSLGAGSDSPVSRTTDVALYDAIEKARDAGIVTVVAACNSDVDFTPPFNAYPADFDNVVSVINLRESVNADGVARDRSSNYNTDAQKVKNISAPGTGIWSLSQAKKRLLGIVYGYDDTYESMSGTSMATPQVAGVLGLMFTAQPSLTADEAVSKLYSTARDLTAGANSANGWDAATGYGEVDAASAVDAGMPYLSGDPVVSGSVTFKVKIDGATQDASGWTWTSSNPEIARVTSDGIVYGYAKGQAIITATKGSQKAVQTVDIVKVATKAPDASIARLKVSVANATYTGKARTPKVTVLDDGRLLEEGVHYTVSYSGNVNAGSAKATVTGIAPYWGSVTKRFTIRKADLSKAELDLSATVLAYSGQKVKPAVAVYDTSASNAQLVRGVDYKLSNPGVVKGKGKVVVTATDACENFTGAVTTFYKVRIVKVKVYELYNARTGQWFYTTDASKRNARISQGWTAKGVAFKAPSKSTQKVWRMYDAKKQRYRLVTGADARREFVDAGWKSRGVAFYADDYRSMPIYQFRNKSTKAWRYSTVRSLPGYKRKTLLAYAL